MAFGTCLFIVGMITYIFSGLWNVPYVSGIMLIKGDKLPMLRGAYSHDELDPDMAICKHMREKVNKGTVIC